MVDEQLPSGKTLDQDGEHDDGICGGEVAIVVEICRKPTTFEGATDRANAIVHTNVVELAGQASVPLSSTDNAVHHDRVVENGSQSGYARWRGHCVNQRRPSTSTALKGKKRATARIVVIQVETKPAKHVDI